MQQVHYQNLGLLEYQAAWDYQTQLHKKLVDNKLANRHLAPKTYEQEHQLLLCEHPPVYTLGRSGDLENLLLNEAELAERGIQFFPINRGGDITFHGPGQIVGYPILDLECFATDVHRYVRNIEEVIIRTLAEYEIEGIRIPEFTGVWVAPRHQQSSIITHQSEIKPNHSKICAIGVHLSRWVTLHGWAFNVNTNLGYFGNIVPCGIAQPDKGLTSLQQELGRPVPLPEVEAKICRHFAEVFDCQLV